MGTITVMENITTAVEPGDLGTVKTIDIFRHPLPIVLVLVVVVVLDPF
jgi:hypothetical protein